ncbi:MAG: hypothetical protein ACYSU8_09010 [Planctomycetota bacterium]|jgi:hypothetical protein
MQMNRFIKKISIASVLTCLFMVIPLKAKTLEFSLFDSYGRKVTSQDYKGVPVFLEFGACW